MEACEIVRGEVANPLDLGSNDRHFTGNADRLPADTAVLEESANVRNFTYDRDSRHCATFRKFDSIIQHKCVVVDGDNRASNLFDATADGSRRSGNSGMCQKTNVLSWLQLSNQGWGKV